MLTMILHNVLEVQIPEQGYISALTQASVLI